MGPKGKAVNLTNAGKGRPKGARNKTTANIRDVVIRAFDQLGGAAELVRWCEKNEKNKGAFYTVIWPKLIPKNIELDAHINHDISARLLAARTMAAQLTEPTQTIDISANGHISRQITAQASVEALLDAEMSETRGTEGGYVLTKVGGSETVK